MNRKGFAITTVIYGLTVLGLMIIVILMGLLSSARNNVSSESKRIEEDLIAYNLASKNYTCNTSQTHTVPKGESGWYRIEAYAAHYGNINGAYTTGIIYLPEGLVLNVCDGVNANVSYNGTVLMKPIPTTAEGSGTLKRYKGVIQNPKFEQFKFILDTSSNLIGSQGITYGDGSEKSEIYGYPAGNTQAPLVGTANGKNVNLYFVDGLMVPGVNSGESRVYITKLADDNIDNYTGTVIDHENKIPGRNVKYNDVTKINVEIKSTDVNLQSLSISHQGTVVSNTCSGSICTMNFASAANIDDISVLFTSGSYNKEIGGTANSYLKIETFKSDGRKNTIYSSEGSESNGEKPTVITPTGIKMSAYQPDWVDDDLPSHGNYYIFPVTTESRVWSARADAEGDSNPILAEYLTGEARQKWSIDIISKAAKGITDVSNFSECKLDTNTSYKLFDNILNGSCATEYRIMELTRFKSITIYKDENIRRNTIAAPETFQSLSRNEPQIWNIKTMNDGTFAIKTVVESSNPLSKTGFLAADTNAEGSTTNPIRIMVGTAFGNTSSVEDKKTTQTAIERVKLYAIDFVR